MTITTSTIKIRKTANTAISSIDIDNTLACKVVVYIDENTKTKDAKVILKHSVADCKRLAFKQARSFLRKFNITAALAKRQDLTLVHRVVSLTINDKSQKVNHFTYRVNILKADVDAKAETEAKNIAVNTATVI